MTKRCKSVVSIMVSMLIVLMLFGSTIIMASANSTQKTVNVNLNSTYGRYEQFSTIEAKEDSTRMFLRTGSSIAGGFLAFPWGGKLNSSGQKVLVEQRTYSGQNYAITQANKSYYLYHSVRGRDSSKPDLYYAAFGFELYTSTIGSATVSWCPDTY